MNKRTVIGIMLALIIIITGTGAFLLFSSTRTGSEQPQAVRPRPYIPHRSQELPFASHRARAMVASQQATSLMPWGMALDNLRGFIWVAEPGCVPDPKCPATTRGLLGKYALSDGTFIQNFNEPGGYSSPLFVVVDREGDVWFTQPNSDAIGEFNPQTGSWDKWSLKKGSIPFDLVFDTHGNLWFTEYGKDEIGFINPRTRTVIDNPIPTPDSNPYSITIDPRGTIWFAENAAGVGQIGSFTPTPSGAIKITEHAVGTLRPHLITTDRAGNIWYSGGFGGDIGEFNPQSGNSTDFLVYHGTCSTTTCTGTHISGIAVDGKGNVWFTDSLSQRVGYIIPSTGQVVARTLHSSNAHPHDGLMIDSSQRVWFTEEFGQALMMWPAGTIK